MTTSTSETPAQVHKRERKRYIRRVRDNNKINKFRSSATIGKIFPQASFTRVVREILQDIQTKSNQPHSYLLSYRAGAALQTAAESYLDGVFEDCSAILAHTNTETLGCGVLHLVQRLRGDVSTHTTTNCEDGYVMVQQPENASASSSC